MVRTPVGSSAALAVALAGLLLAPRTRAEEDHAKGDPTKEEIEAWLDARAAGSRDVGLARGRPEAPPPPPHHRGLVVEAALGALGHLGPLQHVSPTAPWFHAQVGYEVFDFVMLLAEGDVAFSDTQYASPPPEPRSYALYGMGGGLRFTVRPTDRFGVLVQGTIGAARVSEDVLAIYGFRSADQLNPYFGAMAGLEWYQVSPHYGLSLQGGVRNYGDTFTRVGSSEAPLAWIGAVVLRYAF